MAKLLSTVKRLWTTKPLLVNCVTYGTLYGAAELSQQCLIRKAFAEKTEDLDLPLVGRYFVLGSTAFPTFLFFWYKILDSRMVGTTPMMVAAKVVVDQAITAPPILATFYTGMSLMEGKEDIFAECREKFWPTLMSSCMFWIPAQAVNFTFLPTSWRVVYIGCASFAWINILCILKRNPAKSET